MNKPTTAPAESNHIHNRQISSWEFYNLYPGQQTFFWLFNEQILECISRYLYIYMKVSGQKPNLFHIWEAKMWHWSFSQPTWCLLCTLTLANDSSSLFFILKAFSSQIMKKNKFQILEVWLSFLLPDTEIMWVSDLWVMIEECITSPNTAGQLVKWIFAAC